MKNNMNETVHEMKNEKETLTEIVFILDRSGSMAGLETDTIGHAIRTFATTKSEELPVLDNAGDLRGVLALTDLLRYSLPKHLLWMENLTPIYQFQPFAEMLKTAEDNKVADVMREEVVTVESDVPAVQLAKLFLVDKVSQLIITRDGKFAGVVELKSFCARLFWE